MTNRPEDLYKLLYPVEEPARSNTGFITCIEKVSPNFPMAQ
jgi:hypothetical protein